MLIRSSIKHYLKLDVCYLEFIRRFSDTSLNVKRVLILNKRTRYEIEKHQRPGITDTQLEKLIKKRGSDFDTILWHHYRHKDFHKKIVESFSKYDLEVEAVSRKGYTGEKVEWADLVVVGGGDGTFLLGATQVQGCSKPMVGFNTDPDRSEGYLCLPKKYSYNIPQAVHHIVKNEFKWLLRDRIEVEVEGIRAQEEAVIFDQTSDTYFTKKSVGDESSLEITRRVLPNLALNEVFIGENLSSHVSSLILESEGRPKTLVKCSGLCVSTGTGSTSWHMSINRLTRERVARVLQIAGLRETTPSQLDSIAADYNNSLRFPPDFGKMYWSLREPIFGAVVPDPPGLPAAEFASSLWVKSRCSWGCMVIDGTRLYPFNDGTSARLYLNPDKKLRTIQLD